MRDTITIGTRGSQLALTQTNTIAGMIREAAPELTVLIEVISTKGDRIIDRPLFAVGGKGLFTKELESALLSGEIDLAVHSMKDLPTDLPPGLAIAATPAREIPFDALISTTGAGLDDLPEGAMVGTSSLRRRAQLLAYRHDLRITDLRGNVDTRLRRVADGDIDAAVLACAGLERLGRSDNVAQTLDSSIMLPAPAQGILAIEVREDDDELRALLARIDDPKASVEATAERALLAELGGGCRVPVGALARVIGNTITLSGCVCSPDGATVLKTEQSGRIDEAKAIGQRAAAALIEAGAERVIAASLQAVETHHRTPLAGKKVVVTRSREQSEELVSMLEELGAKVLAFPTISIVPFDGGDPKYPLPKYDWLILTSPNAARMFFSQLAARGLGAGDLKSVKVAVIGPGTAEVAQEEGLRVDLMPGKHLADQLFEALLACDPMFEGKRVLLPRSDIAHRFLPDQLTGHGADVTEWVVYRTARPQVPEDKIQDLIRFAPDVVTFTSSSTVENFCAIAGPARIDALRKHTVFASIGPVTTETAREHGLNIAIEPEVHDIPGLVEALVEALTMRTE